ncbi:MAG: DUF1194 domain-containing protein [Pikeienuella sp.]
MKRAVAFASLMAAGLTVATPAAACDVALALTVDVSGSIDPREYRIQMDGLADALDNGDVRDALIAADAMVTIMQWSGAKRQKVTVPWVNTRTQADIDGLIRNLRTAPRAFKHFSTAIGDAILAATLMHTQIAGRCDRSVIDVSGDGRSNEGATLVDTRRALARTEITVNGLAIEKDDSQLSDYFRDEVITGPGSFVVTAKTFDDYARAIRRKLLREIAKPIVRQDDADAAVEVAQND